MMSVIRARLLHVIGFCAVGSLGPVVESPPTVQLWIMTLQMPSEFVKQASYFPLFTFTH